MRLALLSIILLVSCAFGAANTFAQYRFDSWTTDNGLPQNSIYGITQTRDGYIWLATADGLARFDGLRFTTFDQSNSKGLNSNRFINLHQDIEGSLWAGTEDGGLTRYRNGEFTTFTTTDGLPDNQVTKVQDDPEGGLLILTAKGWAQFRNGKFNAYHQPDDYITLQIHNGQSGTRWTWNKNTLTQSKDGRLVIYPLPLRPDNYINTLYEDHDGALWMSTISYEVFRAKDGHLTRYTAKDGLPSANRIVSIYADRDGNVWFGTQGAGLIRFNNGHFTNVTKQEGLSGDVVSIFEDSENTLWVGTTTGGLSRLTRQFIATHSEKDGMAASIIYPILQDASGDIWFGTRLGVSRFGGGVFTNYDVKSLPGMIDDVQSLAKDREGRLWISNTVETVYLRDGKITRPPELKSKIEGVVAILQDRQGSLWFGNKDGLHRLKDGIVTTFTSRDGLPADDVKIIYEDRQSNLWIGTYGGLARLDGDRFTTYTTQNGLISNRVRSLYQDNENVLWIGTYDGGLSRLKDGRITSYTTSQGLFNSGVFQILEDGRGNLWISCNRGIYRVSKQQLNDFADGKIAAITSVAYGKQDGMLNAECNGGRQPAGIKDRDGKLWFPTMGGPVVIDPDAVPFNRQPPPVVIETVNLDSNPVAFRQGIELRPGQSSLEINYTGLSYIRPDQVSFKYKLTGQSDNWVDAGTRRSVNYSYLPPGKYTFTVIARNSDGVWNNTGASVQITVLPPIWRTWWFIAVSVLILTGLALFIYWRRVSQLRREKKAQETFSQRLIESQEGERKRIAAELHDSLSQNLVIIKNRALHSLSTPDDHDRAIEQIEEIAEAANQSLSEVREIAHNLRPFQIDRLGLTKAIDAMANKITSTSAVKVKTGLDPIDGLLSPEMEIHLYRVVQESLNNIIKHSGATEAFVTIRKTEQTIEIVIQDNGKGFTVAAIRGESQNGSGFGLLGLMERARILGGVPVIQSTPGTGTKIELSIRLKDRKNAQ